MGDESIYLSTVQSNYSLAFKQYHNKFENVFKKSQFFRTLAKNMLYNLITFSHFEQYYNKFENVLTLIQLERRRVNLIVPCGFSKNLSSKERAKPWFFVTFNIVLKYIFPENFIEFYRNFLSVLPNFHQFSSVFWIFWHYLATKKLMTSV